MKLDFNVLDKLLLGEAETNDIDNNCKIEIDEFVKTHDFNAFSEESKRQLAGIWDLAMGPAYEHITQTRVPNIFHTIGL